MPVEVVERVDQAVPAVPVTGRRAGLVPRVVTTSASLVPPWVALAPRALALLVLPVVTPVTVARAVMPVLPVADQAVTRPPVPRATRIQGAPVAPAAAEPAVQVLAVPRVVVRVVPQVAVLRVLGRAGPGPVVPVQVMPQGALPAELAVLVTAGPVVRGRPRPRRAVQGPALPRAVVTPRAVMAVLVVARRPVLVGPGRAVPVLRVRAVPELAAQVLPAVRLPVVREVPEVAVRVVLRRPRAVQGRAVPAVPGVERAVPQRRARPLRPVGLRQAVQHRAAQAVARRRAPVTRPAVRPEPPRPPVGQLEAVQPAAARRRPMVLPRTAAPRPATARWAQSGQPAELVELVAQVELVEQVV
jgi:hypothetical protein